MEGYQTLRQLGFGLLDMAYHIKSEDVKDVKAFEDTQTKATQLYPVNPETAISPSFSHVFQEATLQAIILTNGQKCWMQMLLLILKKPEFSIRKLQQNIKYYYLQAELKILWNCIKISVAANLK